MSRWITVNQFILPQDAYIAQGKLESEGIETFLKDELTIQTDNFLSNAVGGVKLQVKEPDFEQAQKLLIEGGFIHESKPYRSKLLQFIDDFTSKLPLIGNSMLEMRILIFAAMVMTVIILLLAFFLWPSSIEKLTDNAWCIERLRIDQEELELLHSGLVLHSLISCDDYIQFNTNKQFAFSNGINGSWLFHDDSLIISEVALEDSLINGKYSIRFEDQYLYLLSKNLELIGSKRKINW